MHSVELLLSLNYLGSFCVCGCAQSCLTLRHHRLLAASLLCLWNFPGKNTGMGCHFLLQRILPTQGLNPWSLHLMHWQVDSLLLHSLGSPQVAYYETVKYCQMKP